ncbi:AraC family transcriptional regulator [Azoarcus sp. DD4]|uniref:AraC family transcriptional regulator n=1 Tax=Azoarcus sp. DD4 TaxID=2027405 RepID=UPI00112792DE|nr:AraC family transcriptional regulator [Azoarcus sp. DD4]QDF97959.1 AraC family transcriptional regulator [Azoarcus sp. DD4]
MNGDPLSDLLRTVRLRGAVFYYVSCWEDWAAEAPPACEIAPAVLPGAEHVMEFHMVARGSGWAAVSGLAPVRLEAGDIVMFPHGDAHVMSSAPHVEPQRIEADWVFATRHDPKPMPVAYHRGVREPGAPAPVSDAETILVCGFLGCDLRPFNPLVAALPRLLHLPAARAGGWVARVIDQAAQESTDPRPGGDAVLERLAEMMFVDTARRYLDSLPEGATGWLAGLRDRYVGRALALLHQYPERPWTMDELGREVGLSRSALHERFMQFIAEPPMHYLANWRIQLGSRLLRESKRTVASIALDVGYESEAAFSRAFKRLVGLPPATWRRTAAAG